MHRKDPENIKYIVFQTIVVQVFPLYKKKNMYIYITSKLHILRYVCSRSRDLLNLPLYGLSVHSYLHHFTVTDPTDDNATLLRARAHT